MKANHASLAGLLFGLVLGAAVFARFRFSFPSFFSGSPGETIGLLVVFGGVPGLIALLFGLFAPRIAALLAVALATLPVAAGFALLDLPTPGVGLTVIVAVVAALVAAAPFAIHRWQKRAAVWVALGLALALTIAGAFAPRPPSAPVGDPTKKVFFFGLDAGTWTMLDKLFATDELPHLRQLRDEGTSGILQSDIESLSPRVWTTMATGKLPEKHGVVDFFSTQNDDLKTRRLWEILQAPGEGRGWSIGLFQWLVTWPPDPFDPFVVPAWMARGSETHPGSLAFIKELERSFQTGQVNRWLEDGETAMVLGKFRDWARGYLSHGLRFSTVRKLVALGTDTLDRIEATADPSGHLAYCAKRTVQLLLNGDVYLELYRRHQPDFSCLILYGTDNLAHKVWQYQFPDDFGIPHEEAAPFRNLLSDYYKAADALLGEVLPHLPRETTIAVVSDHGFTSRSGEGESHQRELKPRVERLAQLIGLDDSITRSAVATRVYITPHNLDPEGLKRVFDRVLKFLGGCTTPDGKTRLFVPGILASGQITIDVNLEAAGAPDLSITTPAGPMRYGDLVEVEERTGSHSVNGILILKGPHIRRSHHLEGARLQDVTPTFLHLLGLPVGSDMDGRVLKDALDPEFLDEHPIERIQSWDEVVAAPTRDTGIVGDKAALNAYLKAQGYTGDNEDQKKRDADEKKREEEERPEKEKPPR